MLFSIFLAPVCSDFITMIFFQGGFTMRGYLSELMPIIVEALMDGAAVIKREVAVSTLGQVVQSTGYFVCSSHLHYM